MARETIANIRKFVYEYLRVNQQGAYGTYLANQRYPDAYITDEIYAADREIALLLIKNNQDSLISEIYETATIASGDSIAGKLIVSVEAALAGDKCVEVDEDTWFILKEGSVFDDTYNDYFIQLESKLYKRDGGDMLITYIEWLNETTIRCPSGFAAPIADLAASRMLMNREDRPQQAASHSQRYKDFMAIYGIEISGSQVKVDEK